MIIGSRTDNPSAPAFRPFVALVAASAFCLATGSARASTASVAAPASGSGPLGSSPAAAWVGPFLAAPVSPDFRPTHLARQDYLALVAANVDFFRKCQNGDGAIIDPYQKREIQYSTPSFALAAAALVAHADRADLLQPAVSAMTWATRALAQHHAADGHSNFYIPQLIAARRLLKDHVPADVLARWDRDLASLNPASSYNTALRGMNWGLVATAGELLRRKDGLVPPADRDAQLKYLEDTLAIHERQFTPFGLYADPGAPLAYDAFARLWLELVMADGAYDGPLAPRIHDFLRAGGLSTLLLLSPTGEWASGGRSAFHNWNEAETIFICEANAAAWARDGRPDLASTFKRAAHLSFESMRRWQRPTGELWIVKNHAEPASRLGYEGYSSHTQYNLLPMAMLAMAYDYADEAIPEHPTPAEAGSYVFDLRDAFHKVAAAAGGYYVLIDTAGDPHYNATGVQRVQRAGVPLSPLSDSATADRAYGPAKGPKGSLAPGIQWQTDGTAGAWRSVAELAPKAKGANLGTVSLDAVSADPGNAQFDVVYPCADSADVSRQVHARYTLTDKGLDVVERLTGSPVTAVRFGAPCLVSDGRDATHVTLADRSATVDWDGSVLRIDLLEPTGAASLELVGPSIPDHNGLVRGLVSRAGPGDGTVHWTASLDRR